MKDVEKFERFEDLKKSEILESLVSESNQEPVEQFIQLLRKNSRKAAPSFNGKNRIVVCPNL